MTLRLWVVVVAAAAPLLSPLVCLESYFVTSETSPGSSQQLCPVIGGSLIHTHPGLDGQTLPQLSCEPEEGTGDRYSHS